MKASENERIMAFVNKMSFPTNYVPLSSRIKTEYKDTYTLVEDIPMEQAKALYRTDTTPWTRLDIHTAGKAKRKYKEQQTLDGAAKDEITYQLVPNSTFLGAVVKALDDSEVNTFGVRVQSHLYDTTGAAFWNSFSFPQYNVKIKTSNGTVREQSARIDVRNSYDRTQRLMYDCGFYDALCLNGQVSGKIFMSYVHKHTWGLDVIKMTDRIYSSIQALPKIAEEYNAWAKKEIADIQAKQIIRKTMAEKMSKNVDGINDKVDELFEVFQNEVQMTGSNLFSLYQMGTWIATHGITKNKGDNLSPNMTDKYRNYVIFMIRHPVWSNTLNS